MGLYFMDSAVFKHGIMRLNDIGTTASNALQCLTLAPDCCDEANNNTGNWFSPNGMMVSSLSSNDIYVVRREGYVYLQRSMGGTPGLYRCEIAAPGGRRNTYYAGLYDSNNGKPQTYI